MIELYISLLIYGNLSLDMAILLPKMIIEIFSSVTKKMNYVHGSDKPSRSEILRLAS